MSTDRYYQVVLIWMKDANLFAEYGQSVGPVVAKYGGSLERMLAPQDIQGGDVSVPDIVNIVYYDSEDAYAAFERDPEFLEIKQKRTDSIDMLALEGHSSLGSVVEGGEPERLYLLELADFGSDGEAGYRRYVQRADAFMSPYGFHVEREIAVRRFDDGLGVAPNVARVTYFDEGDGLEKAHSVPGHEELEAGYNAAVGKSLWLVGSVHAMTLAGA